MSQHSLVQLMWTCIAGLGLLGFPQLVWAQEAKVLIQVVSKHSMEPLEAEVTYFSRSNRRTIVTVSPQEDPGTFQVSLPIGQVYIIEADIKGFRKAAAEVNLRQVTRGGEYAVNLILTRDKNYPDESSLDVAPTLLTTIYFDRSQVDLNEEAMRELSRVFRVMKQFPETRFMIVGHTDVPGSIESNVKLSRLRAQQVQALLISGGIEAFRLRTFGMGNIQRTTPYDDERNLNNRVEIHLVP